MMPWMDVYYIIFMKYLNDQGSRLVNMDRDLGLLLNMQLFLMMVYNEVEGRTTEGRKNEDSKEYFLYESLMLQNFFSCD